MWPFKKPSRAPSVPDDRDALKEALDRAEAHVAEAQELRKAVLPTAREAAHHVAVNHFAQKVKKAYALRETS